MPPPNRSTCVRRLDVSVIDGRSCFSCCRAQARLDGTVTQQHRHRVDAMTASSESW